MKRLSILVASALIVFGALTTPEAIAGGANGDQTVTGWAFIFNHPENCTDNMDPPGPGPCDSIADVFASGGAVVYLTGTRVQSNGRAIFAGSISEDVGHEYVFGELTNAAGAEIHVGLQTHGGTAGDAASRDLQATTPEGACNPDCFILQFAIFPPGAGLGTEQAGAVMWSADGSPVAGASATIKRVDVPGDREMVVISIDTRL